MENIGGFRLSSLSRRKNKMEIRDIINECSAQEQMAFLEWLADSYPDFFEKVQKEYWEDEE